MKRRKLIISVKIIDVFILMKSGIESENKQLKTEIIKWIKSSY